MSLRIHLSLSVIIVQALRVSMEEQRARQEKEAKDTQVQSAIEAGVIPEGMYLMLKFLKLNLNQRSRYSYD